MYEFNDEEAERIWLFGNKIAIIALALAVGAILGFFASILTLSGEANIRDIFLLIEYIFLVVIAFFLFRPSDNFKAIAESEGTDIDELMTGIKDFNVAFLVIAGLIATISVMQFILILLKV